MPTITAFIQKSLLILWCGLFLGVIRADSDVPLPEDFFVQGDITIGAITLAKFIDEDTKTCVFAKDAMAPWQQIEAVMMVIKQINKNESILPGINLGLTAVEGCFDDDMTVRQAKRFRPSNSASRNELSVIGVITNLYSGTVMKISPLLDKNNIPQISVDSTSDILSDKAKYPNFFRMIPSDNVQMRIVLAFMNQQNWTYFSLIYEESEYGQSGRRGVMNNIKYYGMCIAHSFGMNANHSDSYYEHIVSTLTADSDRARVAVVSSSVDPFKKLLEATLKLKVYGQILWIGTDDINAYLPYADEHLKKYSYGMLSSTFHIRPHQPFLDHLRTLTLSNTKSFLYKAAWEIMFDCSLKKDPECSKHTDITKAETFYLAPTVTRYIDSVMAFAKALEAIRKNHCRQTSKSEVVDCIVNYAHTKTKRDRCSLPTRNKKNECWEPGLVYYLKEITFPGVTGMVHFDVNGDRNTPYDIYQTLPKVPKLVRTVLLDSTANIVMEDINDVTWKYLTPSKFHRSNNPLEYYGLGAPSSACIVCCEISEIIVNLDTSCCQRNTKCRSKRSIEKDSKYCEACNFYEWPDLNANRSRCTFIHSHLDDPFAYILFALSGCGMLISICILGTMIIYNESSVVRLWSRELSFIAIISIIVGFVNNMLAFAPHTTLTCLMEICLRTFSETSLFDSLFFKTFRIYRVFHVSNLSSRSMRLVSPRSQIVMALALVIALLIIQLILVDYDRILEEVETTSDDILYLICYPGWAAETAYYLVNIAIILACAFFAFKNRILPDRFREPHHMWIAFIISTTVWYAYGLLIRYRILNLGDNSTLLLAIMRFLFFSSAVFSLFSFRLRDLYRSIRR